MPGGLLQLVAYGSADLFLTGNPQMTFFKSVYKRHTNFSMEHFKHNFDTFPNLSPDNKVIAKVKINRHADLLFDSYLVVDLPTIYSTELERFQWIRNVGENVINSVEILVGGHRIDMHYGQWLNIWNQLILTDGERRNYNKMIGNIPDLTYPLIYKGAYSINRAPTIEGRRLYIPFHFWFNENPGLALPLIALQYHEIHVNIEYNEFNKLFTLFNGYSPEYLFQLFDCVDKADPDGMLDSLTDEQIDKIKELKQQWANEGFIDPNTIFWKFVNGTTQFGIWNQNTYLDLNYVYLDTDERRMFARSGHEYLISQVQRQTFEGLSGTNRLEIQFNHPIKELVIVAQRNDVWKRNEWNNYTNCTKDLENDYHNYHLNLRQQLIDFADTDPDQCCLDFNEHLDQINDQTRQILEDEQFDNSCLLNRANVEYIGNSKRNIVKSWKLILNGHDRFEERDSVFFNALQPFKHHTGSPNEGVLVYSFAINPENHQPSGTLNFSRINKAYIHIDLRDLDQTNTRALYDLYVYARGTNILRIMSGMGSVLFSN